jgi:glutathione synthase/RimK-type ligase-like ATP-grasp enzyme
MSTQIMGCLICILAVIGTWTIVKAIMKRIKDISEHEQFYIETNGTQFKVNFVVLEENATGHYSRNKRMFAENLERAKTLLECKRAEYERDVARNTWEKIGKED